ncbi:MAG: serine/threonine-protein kinase [Enhygromyxa sp.]
MDPENLKQGSVFGNWQLVNELSREGGQAVVWRAKSKKAKHSPMVAIKILRHADEQSRLRFEQEAELLASVEHPNIIALRGHGMNYHVLELASFSLDTILKENPKAGAKVLRQSPAMLLSMFRDACRGVAHLHKSDILHRDIKPSNVLVIDEPREVLRIVVSDLGIGTREHEQGKITKTNEVVGSPIYRAWEVLAGRPATFQSDVYSLGRTLEAIMNGRHPQNHTPDPCPRGRILSDDACEQLDHVIRRACSHNPKHRYANAEEFADALPELRLGVVGGPVRATGLAFDRRLGRVLGELIGHQSDQEPTSIHILADSVKGELSSYDISIAIGHLQRAGLIEIRDEEDWNQNYYKACWVTDAGFRLAIEWDDKLRAIMDPRQRERYGGDYVVNYAASTPSSDDDIPF